MLHDHAAHPCGSTSTGSAHASDGRRLMAFPRFLALAMAVSSGTACVSFHTPSFFEPAPRREWPATLSAGAAGVSEGRFALADSLLARFAADYPGTTEALEAMYWRALNRLDPSNPQGSVPEAIKGLDVYI